MKRYEALYIGPNMLDGFYDNKTKQYLDDKMIEDLLNEKDCNSIWEEKCKRLAEENKQLWTKIHTMNIKKRNYLNALKALEEDYV